MKYFILKTTANLSTGGTAIDVTDSVHPANIHIAERAIRIVGLDIGGVDIVAPDITTPLSENNGGIVELNAAPGFRMHLQPTKGLPRNVAEPVIRHALSTRLFINYSYYSCNWY